MGNLLDVLIGLTIQNNGVPMTRRGALNFLGATVTDDAANNRTNVDTGSGGGGGGGGSGAPVFIVPASGYQTFNGDGSGGANQLFPHSIIFAHVDGVTINYDFFDNGGVEEGWLAWFNVEGTAGTLVIRDRQSESPIIVDVISTDATAKVVGIYFDGSNWQPLAAGNSSIQGGEFLPTYVVNAASYAADSRTAKDVVLLVDTSSNTTTVTLPAHAAGRLLFIKDLKANAAAHPITVHRNGGTGTINNVAADIVLAAAPRDYCVLLSDGVSNWVDLVAMGVAPMGSTDPGQNVSLATANTVVQAASAACPGGFVAISADSGNSAQVHVGRANTVTAGPGGKGARLPPGQSIVLPAANANEFYFVSTGTGQNVGVLAI